MNSLLHSPLSLRSKYLPYVVSIPVNRCQSVDKFHKSALFLKIPLSILGELFYGPIYYLKHSFQAVPVALTWF